MPVAKEVKKLFNEKGLYFRGSKGVQFHPNGKILEMTLNGASQEQIQRTMSLFGSDGGVYVYSKKKKAKKI